MKKHKIARFGAKLEPDFNLPKLNLELGGMLKFFTRYQNHHQRQWECSVIDRPSLGSKHPSPLRLGVTLRLHHHIIIALLHHIIIIVVIIISVTSSWGTYYGHNLEWVVSKVKHGGWSFLFLGHVMSPHHSDHMSQSCPLRVFHVN